MPNRFVDKLRNHAALTDDDVAVLEGFCANPREVPARHDLFREGDKPGPLFIFLDGWACRYNSLPDGSRQITAFLMPGDFCDLHAAVLDEMDHSIMTLTPATIAAVPRPRMENAIAARPALVQAVWWVQLVNEGTLRAWIVSMGRRDSVQRVAHLMCELYVRARSVGLADGLSCELPLTQIVLGDALGLTPVHVNRVLRRLRVAGLLELGAGSLTISNIEKVARLAGFDDTYLHRRLRLTA